MSHRGVALTFSLFLVSSVLPAGAQKIPDPPKATDNAAKANEAAKNAELKGGVLKRWAEDVFIIITDEERKAFGKLTKDEERENFIENFWLARDPSPDTQENEFREEYYERIDYANDHFASGIAGMRTDRGKMYILNGPPDQLDTHPTGGVYQRTAAEGGGETNSFPFETWRYRHIDGKGDNIIYEFVDTSMSGEYSLQYDPGAKDALKNVPNMGLTAIEMATGVDKSERYNKTNSLLSGMSANIPDNYGENNMFDMLEKYNNAFKPPDVNYNEVMVPALTRLSNNVLPFKIQANYIKVAEEVRTLITMQILTKDLAFQDVGGTQTAQAQISCVLYKADNKRIPCFTHSLLVQFPTLKAKNEKLDQPNLFQETKYLVPGKYKLHLTVEDRNSQNIGITDYLLVVPRIPDQTLQASSMILAYSVTNLPTRVVGAEMFALGDKKVQPNITGVFRRDQNLNVWQEIYGLSIDQATHKPSATFEMVVSQNKQDIRTLVTNSTELAGSGQQMKYTNSMPLADLAPGQYEVQIKVTDNLAKESFVTSSKFTVTPSPAK